MIHRYLVVTAALAVAVPSSVPAQSVRAGIQAWQQADYAKAVGIWRPLAEKGDADAAFNLGQAYRLGRGVETNIAAASTWYQRAAAKGHLDAQTTLGLLLFQNGDQAGGLQWLRKAADKGEPRALLVYGTALVNGDGVKRDVVLGYALVSRAAAQGLAPAKETLAQLDQLLSVDARKKGVAIAMAKAKSIPAPKSTPARQAPAPKSVEVATAKTVEVPADRVLMQRPSNAAREICGEAADVDLTGRNLARRCRHAVVARAAAQARATAAPATGAWRIQLGAFSKRASAEALYQAVSGNGALAGRQPFYIPVGPITRLQVGPFESKAAAAAACRAVGTACFPVPAK
jgi:TPR repeat protein